MSTNNTMIRRLAVGTLLLLGTAGAGAQSAPVGSAAAQAALQGAWNVRMTPYDCITGQTFPAAAFLRRLGISSGGTLTEANFNPTFQTGQRSTGLGTWERTGPATYRAVTEAYVFVTTPRYARGFQRIDETMTLQDADHYIGSGRTEFTDEQGNLGIQGCFNTVGERQQ
jgi:hypothetical protein